MCKNLSSLFELYFDIQFKLPVINNIRFLANLFQRGRFIQYMLNIFFSEEDILYILIFFLPMGKYTNSFLIRTYYSNLVFFPLFNLYSRYKIFHWIKN